MCTRNVEFDRSHVVLSVGHILFEFIPRTVFPPCNTVVVFEMYSLIGILVIMRDHESDALTGTFEHTSRFKYGQFRSQTGLYTVQKCFMSVSIAHTFIACASSVECNLFTRIGCLHVKRDQSSPC